MFLLLSSKFYRVIKICTMFSIKRKYFCFYFLLLFILFLFLLHKPTLTTYLSEQRQQTQPPLIRTSSGVLRGFTQSVRTRNAPYNNVGGVLVDTFLGVPFAQPPLGPLRFRPPLPVRFWSGIRNATQLPNSCWQEIDTNFGQIWGILLPVLILHYQDFNFRKNLTRITN